MVISTAVKNKEPFKNLIVNGIVLAEDGTKMSKSKRNYQIQWLCLDNLEQMHADYVCATHQ